jgi:hypothetical protein
MNYDKIKELAEQAGYYLYDLTETHECKTVETDSKDEWITLEKFAELIVKECIFMADEFELDVNRVGLVDRIKQHFGVKE